MKKILLFILVLVSVQVFGQNPSNYQYRTVRERLLAMMVDSSFHIPRYNGVPSGLRTGSSTHDGSLAADTLNHNLYFWSNSVWARMAKYSDIAGQKFGLDDVRFGEDRYVSGAGLYSLGLDSLSSAYIGFDSNNGLIFYDYAAGINIYRHNATSGSQVYSQNGNNYLQVNDGVAQLVVGSGDSIVLSSVSGKIYAPNIPYNSGAALVGLAIDTLTNRVYRKTAGGSDTHIGNTNLTLTGDRSLNGDNLNLTLYNLQSMVIGINPSGSQDFDVYDVGGASRVKATNIFTSLASANSGNSLIIYDDTTHIALQTSSKLLIDNITYNSGVNVVGLVIDTLTNQVFRKTAGGGGGSGTVNTGAALKAAYYPTATTVVDDVTGVEYNNTNILQRNTSQAATDVTLKNVAHASQSADVLQNTTSGGTALFNLRANGAVDIQNTFEPWYNFIWNGTTNQTNEYGWNATGTGAAVTNMDINTGNYVEGWMYATELSTGTTNTGRAYVETPKAAANFGASISMVTTRRYNVGAKLRLEDLSDVTDTYTMMSGWGNSNNAVANITHGIYFTYDYTISSGQFVAVCEQANTPSSTATGITVAADTDYELEISVFGGSAYFYINKALVATISTNLPSSSQLMSEYHQINKSAGTNARKMYIDWAAHGFRKN